MAKPGQQLIEVFTDLFLRVNRLQDPDKALREIFKALQRLFPLDFLNMPIYDSKRGTLRYMAIVTDEQTMIVDETVKLSSGGQIEAEAAKTKKFVKWNNTEKNELTRAVAEQLGMKGVMSTIALVAEMNPAQFGALGLVAMGPNRYTDTHFSDFTLLYEPLAGMTRYVFTLLEVTNVHERLIIENKELKRRLGYLGSSRIMGADSGLKEVMEQVEQVAPLESPVLIMGETGVGKEIVATAIHQRSRRANKPILSLNCGAIPETLLDSELFGYERGAFTGATSLKRGYFEQADGGTVFLDEVGELSLQAQVKLLRMLQTMEFQRVGGSRSISIDIRVIAATNRDLESMVKSQQFRKDLWFRLNVFPIRIPPLRERKEDIPALAEYFIRRKSLEINLPHRPSFAPGAIAQLQAYDWPGNVRELQNILERALILSRGKPLSFEGLSPAPMEKLTGTLSNEDGRFMTMDEMTAHHIRKSLVLSKGRIAGPGGAAVLLDIHPSTLRGKMRKLGIRISRKPSGPGSNE